MATDAAVAGLESNNLTVRSGQPYTPPGIAAKSNTDDRIGNSCRAASAAASSNFSGITWILAEGTLQKSIKHIRRHRHHHHNRTYSIKGERAHSELVHDGLGNGHSAGVEQSLDCSGVETWLEI
jgi:hypothetical protein